MAQLNYYSPYEQHRAADEYLRKMAHIEEEQRRQMQALKAFQNAQQVAKPNPNPEPNPVLLLLGDEE